MLFVWFMLWSDVGVTKMLVDEQYDVLKRQAPLKSFIKVNQKDSYDYKKQLNKVYSTIGKSEERERLVERIFERNQFTMAKGY